MNRSVLSRALSVLFFTYVLGYGAFLLYSILTFTAANALPAFQWQYEARRAFLLFLDYLIPLQITGVTIAFSLGAPAARSRAASEPVKSFGRMVSSTMATFVFLTIAYAALSQAVAPSLRAKLADIEYESRLAREFRSLAEQAHRAGDFSGATAYAELYLKIDPNNAEMLTKKQTWSAQAIPEKPENVRISSAAPQQPAGGSDASVLMQKARQYFSRGDYYSAHYFASQAQTLEPGRTDAIQLAARAMEKITRMAPSTQDAAAAELYTLKKQAYDTLTRGDFFAAYYSFTELSKKYPKDKDIAEYLEASRIRVQSESFFMDQAESAEKLPGTQSILFINKDEENYVEAVSIGKLVETVDGLFALDVEAAGYTPAGSVIWHFTARCGQLRGNKLLLRAVDRNKPSVQYLPRYISGSRAAGDMNLLELTPGVGEMSALAVGRGGIPMMSLPLMWSLRGRLEGLGVSGQAVSAEIITGILMPFVFLTLSFFSMAFGWAFRARYLSRPPLPLYVFAPLIPAAAALVTLLWVHAHKVLLGFVLLAAGLAAALVVCIILELALLIVSLIVLAGQASS